MVATELQQQWRGAGLEREQEKEGEVRGQEGEWRMLCCPLRVFSTRPRRAGGHASSEASTRPAALWMMSALFTKFKISILPQKYV